MSLDLFVPALAGYLVLRLSNATRFGLLRESGYHVVFRAALVGLLLYTGGWTLAVLVPTPEDLTRALKETPFGLSASGVWSLVPGMVSPALWNTRCDPVQGARRAADKKGDFLDLLVDEAGLNDQTVEIALSGGKAFIGYVAESGINKQGLDEGSLVLVPLLSGYRSERDRRLVLTTNYTRLLIDDPEMWEHLKLAIPRSDIRWARLFDPGLYAPREGEEQPEDVGDNH